MVITLTSGQKEVAQMIARKNSSDYAIATTSAGEKILVCHVGSDGRFGNVEAEKLAQSLKVVSCYPALVENAYDGMNWNTRTSFSLFGNRLTVGV